MTDLVRLGMEFDARSAPVASKHMDDLSRSSTRVEKSTRRAERSVERYSRRLSRGTSIQRRSTLAVQNAAFQVGDFAVQVAAGTDASRALAQQLPQLLGGFGVVGAVAGALVAIIIPLRSAMSGLSRDGREVTEVFGTLQPVARSVETAIGEMKSIIVAGAEVVVNNIDRILTIGATAVAFFAGRWVAGMIAARVATFSFSASLVALRTALIRTGIGALIVGAGELAFQFTRLSKATGGVSQAAQLMGGVVTDQFDKIRRIASLFGEAVSGVALVIEGAFISAFDRIANSFINTINSVIGGLNTVRELGGAAPLDLIPTREGGDGSRLTSDGKVILQSVGRSALEILNEPSPNLQKLRDLLANISDERISLDDLFSGLGKSADDAGGKVGDTAKELSEFGQAGVSAVTRVTDALGQFVVRGLNDFRGLMRSFVGSFRDMIAQIISIAARNRILIGLGLTGGGTVAGTAASAAGSGILNSVVSGSGGGLLGNIGEGSILGGFTGGSGVLGGFGSSLSGIASGFGSGGFGGAISGAFGAISGASGVAATIGAALPIVGLGLALFGLFKRKPIISQQDFAAIQTGLELTGQALFDTGRAGQRAAKDLLNIAGGADDFTSKTQTFFDLFFSEQEKRQKAQEAVNNTFESLGLALPGTNREFRDLVQSLDLTTAEGRKTYNTLLDLAPTFAGLTNEANRLNDALSGSQGIFATLQDQEFVRAQLAQGNTNVDEEMRRLMLNLIEEVRAGNLQTIKNTYDTYQQLLLNGRNEATA